MTCEKCIYAEGLRQSLVNMLHHYTRLVNSGDAGNWNPEEEPVVIAARAALANERTPVGGLTLREAARRVILEYESEDQPEWTRIFEAMEGLRAALRVQGEGLTLPANELADDLHQVAGRIAHLARGEEEVMAGWLHEVSGDILDIATKLRTPEGGVRSGTNAQTVMDMAADVINEGHATGGSE